MFLAPERLYRKKKLSFLANGTNNSRLLFFFSVFFCIKVKHPSTISKSRLSDTFIGFIFFCELLLCFFFCLWFISMNNDRIKITKLRRNLLLKSSQILLKKDEKNNEKFSTSTNQNKWSQYNLFGLCSHFRSVYVMLSLLLHVKIFMWIFQVNEYAQKVIYLMYIREKGNCETLQQIPI